MSECIVPQYRDMLHAWELGMLPEDERQSFELHLLECDDCSEEAKQFLSATRMLVHDPEFRPSADELAENKSADKDKSSSFRKNLTRLLLVAAAILVVAIPVYKWTLMPSSESVQVQQLKLVPMRNGGENTIRHDLGGRVEIYFYVEGAISGRDYHVMIASDHENPVYSSDHFRDFNQTGMGRIELPVKSLNAGFYKLTIGPGGDSLGTDLRVYNFQVE
jgi:hypothetical protein